MNKDRKLDTQTCKSMEKSGEKIGKREPRKNTALRLNEPAPFGVQGGAISIRRKHCEMEKCDTHFKVKYVAEVAIV